MRAYLLLLVMSVAALFAQPAHAQSVCGHFADSTLGIDTEGSPASVCELASTRWVVLFPDRAPTAVIGCVYTEGVSVVVSLSLSNPTDTMDGYSIAQVGACTSEPPASEPEAVAMDWADTNHLLQALLIACCVFMLVNGIGQGNRL